MDFLTPIEIEAIRLSLKISFWAMLWSLPLALGTAWVLARYSFPGKFLLDGIITDTCDGGCTFDFEEDQVDF